MLWAWSFSPYPTTRADPCLSGNQPKGPQSSHLYFSFIFVFPTAPLHLLLLSSLLPYFSLNFPEKPGFWFGLLSLGYHLSDNLNTFCGPFSSYGMVWEQDFVVKRLHWMCNFFFKCLCLVFIIKWYVENPTDTTKICIMKSIFDKPTSTIIFNGKKLKSFLLRSQTRQGCPLLPLLFNTLLKVLAIEIRQIKEIKGTQIVTVCR